MAASNYITAAQLAKTLNLTGTTFASDDIDVAIAAASRACDGYKNDRFYPTTETRLYTGRTYDRHVDIDSANTVASVTVDTAGTGAYGTTWTAGVEFYLDPANAGLDGFPYTKVVLRSQSGSRFPGYDNGVRIQGSFGWAAAPAAVTQATTILAGRFLKRARETPYGILTVTGDAVAAARLGRIDPDVAFLLDNLPGSVPLLAV
jgi:hypothetical protein